MINKYFRPLLFILAFSTTIIGQDLNHTNYRYSPLDLNPAQTGSFYGTVRLGANYRSQGQRLLLDGYNTSQIYVDAPINFALRKNDWVGVGFQLFSDKGGTLPVTSTSMLLNIAYHISLDNNQKSILGIGASFGIVQKKLDSQNAILESDFRGTTQRDRNLLRLYDENYKDFNLGVNFLRKLKKEQHFAMGLSFSHFLKPVFKGLVQDNYVEPRISLHAEYHYRANDQLYFEPKLVASFSGKAYNVMPQFLSFYKLKKESKDKVYLGLGYRLSDALQLMTGISYKGYDFGFSYDFTVSSASTLNDAQGGWEFGIFKIISIAKPPSINPFIFCPRY